MAPKHNFNCTLKSKYTLKTTLLLLKNYNPSPLAPNHWALLTLEKVSQPQPTKIFDRSFLKFFTLMVALLNVGVAFFQRLLQVYPHWVVLPLGYEIKKKLRSKIADITSSSVTIKLSGLDRSYEFIHSIIFIKLFE